MSPPRPLLAEQSTLARSLAGLPITESHSMTAGKQKRGCFCAAEKRPQAGLGRLLGKDRGNLPIRRAGQFLAQRLQQVLQADMGGRIEWMTSAEKHRLAPALRNLGFRLDHVQR